jgi:hypothetical protein
LIGILLQDIQREGSVFKDHGMKILDVKLGPFISNVRETEYFLFNHYTNISIIFNSSIPEILKYQVSNTLAMFKIGYVS